MKRLFAVALAGAMAASSCMTAFASPAKTGKSIAGYGSANYQSLLDYKGETDFVINTDTEYKEELPKLEQRDTDANSETLTGVVKPLIYSGSQQLELLVDDPFSDLYFDDVFSGPTDEEFSWLVENNVISRDHDVTLGRNGVEDLVQYPVYDRNTLNTPAKKSDFLVGIYKALFGAIESRPIVFQADSVRTGRKITYVWVEGTDDSPGYWRTVTGETKSQVTSSIGKSDIVTSTFVDYWEYDYTPYGEAGPTQYYINKNGDLLYYLNPNVYELYLTAMLNKNLISREEISDTQFLAEYDDILKKSGKKPTLPEWYGQIGPFLATGGPDQLTVQYTPSASENWLGKRYKLSGVGGETVQVKFQDGINYFMQENLSVMTALRYVEKFLRVTEEDLTDAEAQTIAYKYGVSYLSEYTEEERGTLMFLVAKGILDFENPEEYRNLYGSLTDDYMYTLLYRLARPEARRKFHDIQLTDTDNFWLERGYQESRYVLKKENDTRKVRLVEDGEYVAMPVPNVETISVTEKGGTGRSRQEGGSTVYSNFYADDDESLKTFEIVKEFDNIDKYRFNGKRIDQSTTGSVDPYVKVSGFSGNRVTFSVQAQTDVIALAAVDSKLQVATDSVYDDHSLRSVTKISSSGEETTLVHQSTFQEADSELMVLEDKVLKNKTTGATAVLLPEQGMALVGSHVIVSDDIMVTSVNGEVYYNLDVVTTLMSNAYMSDINPFDIYQVKNMYTEQSIPVQSPSGNQIGSVLAMTMKNSLYGGESSGTVAGLTTSKGVVLDLMSTVVTNVKNLLLGGSGSKEQVTAELMRTLATAQKSLDGGGEGTAVEEIEGFNFVNLSQSLEGSNHLIRDFEVSTYEGKTVKYKMLLYFTFEVPDMEFDFENPEVWGDNPSLKDFNEMMTERPEDRALAEYWDNNLELSNAFANVIYGTSGVKYVKNGYLMPNVRIMYQDNALIDDDVLYDLMVKVGSELSGDFVDTYLGTTQYNAKVSDENPPDMSSVYYPAKELTRNMLPLWVHALFNNKQETLAAGTSSLVVSNEPKSGRKNTQLWRYMMAERSFSYLKPVFSAASLNVYVFNDDVFLVTDSNAVYKLDSEKSKIMPGKIEGNAFHMESRTSQTMAEMKKLIGTVVTFESGGEVSSFYFEGFSGNHLVLVDTAYVEGTPRTAGGSKMGALIEIDGTVHYPSGGEGSSSSTQFSNRYRALTAMFEDESQMDSVVDLALVTPYGLPREVKIPEAVYVTKLASGVRATNGSTFKRYLADGSEGESLSLNSIGTEKVRAHARLLVNCNHFKIDANGMIYFKASPSLYSAGNVYFSSLNKGLMDSMIAKAANVVSVNELTDGQKLLFTDTTLVKNGNWFYSEPQYNVSSWEELIKAWNDPEGQKEAVLRYFAGTVIDTSRVQVSLSAFIEDAGLGRIKPGVEPDGTLVGSAASENEALVFEKDGSSEAYSGFSETNVPKSVAFRVLLDDTLLCRLVDEESQIYELLYATNALSEGYLEDIPFFNESLSLEAKDDLFYRLNLNDFKVSYMASELKTRFLENYREARAGEVKELLQFLIALLVVVYTFMLWIAWIIVRGGIGRGIFLALKYPTNGSRAGVDVVRVLTLGTFDLESDVDAGRIVITTLALMILALILTMI